MIQTQIYSAPEPKDLEASINLWVKENLNYKIVSIEYAIAHVSTGAAPGWQAEIRPLFTALIVYQTPKKSFIQEREKKPIKINRPTDMQGAYASGDTPIIIPKGQLPIDNSLDERG